MGLAVPTDSPAEVVVRKTIFVVARNVKWMCTFVNMDLGIKKDISVGTRAGDGAGAGPEVEAEAILSISIIFPLKGKKNSLVQ